MDTLKDTIDMMVSDEYKDRFKAEISQLRIRISGLTKMLNNWDSGDLKFKPATPRSVFEWQLKAMKDYLTALEARARIESIE